MPNIIRIEFDASDEAQASAKIKEFRGEVESLPATTRRASEATAQSSTQAAASLDKASTSAKTYAQQLREQQQAARAAGTESLRAAEAAKTASATQAKSAETTAAILKKRATETTHLSEQALATRARLADEAYVKEERAAARAAAAARAPQAQSAGGGSPNARSGIPGFGTALGFAGEKLGLPGLGSAATSLSLGGVASGVAGLAIAGLAIRELIKLSNEAEQSQINLAVSARNTGRTFAESQATAESFRREMVANNSEAALLAAAFGELQLRSGEAIKPGDTAKLSTLANAQGLSPEDAAKAIQGLARGSKEAFEQLTGTRADLVLDRYAQSVNTTTDKLTDMERVQALSNAAFREANGLTDIAAQRMSSLDSRWQSFKNTLGEVAAFIPKAGGLFLDQFVFSVSGGQFGAGAEETYRRAIAESGEGEANAAYARQVALANKRKAEEAARNEQQRLVREQEQRFTALDRNARARPENYQAGLSSEQRGQHELTELRAQRERLQAEYDAFKIIRAQFSNDDAVKIDEQFQDRLQQTTDKIRGNLQQLAADAEAKAKQFTQSVLTARDALRSFLSDAAQQADRDNPLTSLFIRARTEVEETRKRFLIFGADFANEMARIKKESIDGELALARFTSGFTALKLLQEARRLQQPFVGLTGPQERRRDVIGSEVSNLTEGEEYRRRARALENPSSARNARVELEETFQRLQALNVSGAGRAGQEAKADAILNLLKDVDPRALTGTARGALIDANRTKAAGFEENVRDAIQRERTGNLIQTDARELLKSISASGLRDDAKLREFLSVTGSLNDKELTAELRQGRVSALRESAQLETAKERNAEVRAKKLEIILDRFDKMLTERGIKVDAGPAAQINISSKDLNATQSTLGPAMSPDVKTLQRSIQF